MAQITYESPVKHVSGKLFKADKVIYQVRKAPTSNVAMIENHNYTSVCGKRSTPYSDAEKAAQTRFGKICMATNARLNDASQQAADIAAFKAQSTYVTLRQYVWHQCAATIEESVNYDRIRG